MFAKNLAQFKMRNRRPKANLNIDYGKLETRVMNRVCNNMERPRISPEGFTQINSTSITPSVNKSIGPVVCAMWFTDKNNVYGSFMPELTRKADQ